MADLDCTEGCRLERIGDAIVVHGDAPLGVQYGLAAMHHPRPLQITSDNPNATIYQFGYLKMGHDLCYWNRERAQVRNLVLGTTEAVPPCVF